MKIQSVNLDKTYNELRQIAEKLCEQIELAAKDGNHFELVRLSKVFLRIDGMIRQIERAYAIMSNDNWKRFIPADLFDK